jgi:hypothetical protein
MPDGLDAQVIPIGNMSDREIIIITHTRQEVLIEQVQGINGRLRLTERLAWIAIGAAGIVGFLATTAIGVWSVIVAMR